MPNSTRQLLLDLGQAIGAEMSLGRYWILDAKGVNPRGPGRSINEFLDPLDPQKAVAAARSLPHDPGDGGVSLANRFTQPRLLSWWVQAYSLYNGAGQRAPWNQAWLFAMALHRILDKEDPVGLFLHGGGPDLVEVCRAIAKIRRLTFQHSHPQKWPLKARILRLYGERLKHGFRALNGLLVPRKPVPKCQILFYGVTLQRLSDGKWTHGNFTAVQDTLRQRNISFQSIFFWNHLHTRPFCREAADSGYYPIESLYSLGNILRLLGWVLAPHLSVRTPAAPESTTRMGLGPLFQRKMRHFLQWREPESRLMAGVFTRLLQRTTPRMVVMIDEADSLGISLVAACRTLGIPTLAIQHGIIHPQHFGYVHDPRDHQASPPSPLPDQTLVYGPFFEETLIQHGHYPEGRIQITGSARHDAMLATKALPKDPEFHAYLGVPLGSKVVVLTTQPLPNPKEVQDILVATCQAMEGIKDAALVIKPHPREWDLSIYENAIRIHRLSTARVIPNADLSRLFRNADLTIAQSSTTLIESLLLGCPAITLNLTGLQELLPYAQSGACLEVTRAEELEGAIRSILTKSETYDSCVAATPDFLKSMLGPMDSKATERIVKICCSTFVERQPKTVNKPEVAGHS